MYFVYCLFLTPHKFHIYIRNIHEMLVELLCLLSFMNAHHFKSIYLGKIYLLFLAMIKTF